MTLREFIEEADKAIVSSFNARRVMVAVYFIQTEDGKKGIIPAPPVPKDMLGPVMRAILEEIKATRFLFVCESWTMRPKDAEESKWMIEYMRNNSIADHPRAIEVLMYSAEDQLEGSLMGARDIIRKDGKVSLGPLDLRGDGQIEGRFTGLLPRKGRAN